MSIPLSKPDVGEREIRAVTDCLRSGRLSLGPLVQEFETKFAVYIGSRYAIAASSGTAALHLCVKALGIGAFDDVITTAFTFVASTNCLLYENARPVFADIDSRSLNLDPHQIRQMINRNYIHDIKTNRWSHRHSGRILKAILPVHVFGFPCDMDPILEIAREFRLQVLEDACEALGAEYRHQRIGSLGDAAVFAFYPNKQITTAEGGMIVTDNPAIAEVCRSLRNQGRAEDAGWLVHDRLGFNYRLSELHCALGLAQMERLDEFLERRNHAAGIYSQALADVPGVLLPPGSIDVKRSWFAYVIRLLGVAADGRDQLIAFLHARGIDCRPYFPAIHQQPYFRALQLDSSSQLPHTESASNSCLALPFFPSITPHEICEVASAVREFLAHSDTQSRMSVERPARANAQVAQ
jgi:perosamine synthetase